MFPWALLGCDTFPDISVCFVLRWQNPRDHVIFREWRWILPGGWEIGMKAPVCAVAFLPQPHMAEGKSGGLWMGRTEEQALKWLLNLLEMILVRGRERFPPTGLHPSVLTAAAACGDGNSIQVFHLGGRHSVAWIIPTTSQGLHLQKVGVKSWNQDLAGLCDVGCKAF